MLNIFSAALAFGEENIKLPNVAGVFYPAEAVELSAVVDKFLVDASTANEDIGVLIAPHAGYYYSGAVAGRAFKAVVGRKIKTVVILAPSHYFSFQGASVWAGGAFRTPLGDIAVDEDLAARILKQDKRFVFDRSVFEREHAIETHLPFIQKIFPGAKIVPIILGQPDLDLSRALGQSLSAATEGCDDVLLDVSSDLSHFHKDDDARIIDRRGLDAVQAMDVEQFWNGHVQGVMEIDAFHAITAAMVYAAQKKYDSARVVYYGTSADVTADKSRVVGYAAVAFSRELVTVEPTVAVTTEVGSGLTDAQKNRLLSIARTTLDEFVRTGKVSDVTEVDPLLQREEGAFVTLHLQGQLRGCIGNILGSKPLYQTVRDMAIAAASQDSRFTPVTPHELPEIVVEVSVLSVPQRIHSVDEIVMGKHGVIVSRGNFNRGVFLPQVALETGWDRATFLSELCSQKAGLPSDSWKDPATVLEVFTADVFSEKSHK